MLQFIIITHGGNTYAAHAYAPFHTTHTHPHIRITIASHRRKSITPHRFGHCQRVSPSKIARLLNITRRQARICVRFSRSGYGRFIEFCTIAGLLGMIALFGSTYSCGRFESNLNFDKPAQCINGIYALVKLNIEHGWISESLSSSVERCQDVVPFIK